MLIFNLTTLHFWGRVLGKHPQVRALPYPDDDYIKTKMSATLQVLTELQDDVSKTSVLPKGFTRETTFDVEHNIINVIPALTHSSGDVVLTSFCPGGFVGIGVSIGTCVLYPTLKLKHVGK